METLYNKHRILISQASLDIVREVMHTISWDRQLVAIRGSRGVGKTTLLRVALGLLKPGGGTAENRFRKTAAVFQEPRLLPWRTARENVNLVLGDRKDTAATAQMWLSRLGLSDGADKYPRELSGGELQRFCVARALMSGAEYLICDEISTMLDVITQAQIWNGVLEEARSFVKAWEATAETN